MDEVSEKLKKRLKDIADGNESGITEDLLENSSNEVHDVEANDNIIEDNITENVVDDVTTSSNDRGTDGGTSIAQKKNG